jgi:hypothetical protein
MISFKTQKISFSDDINELLCQIDVKLAKISENKLKAERYGAKLCVNMEDYKSLSKYRSILVFKANNHRCLSEFLVDDIIVRIKQLLNRN